MTQMEETYTSLTCELRAGHQYSGVLALETDGLRKTTTKIMTSLGI